MTNFADITPNELIVLSTAIAVAISEGKNADDLNILGNFLQSVATSILTIAAQKEYIEIINKGQNQEPIIR